MTTRGPGLERLRIHIHEYEYEWRMIYAKQVGGPLDVTIVLVPSVQSREGPAALISYNEMALFQYKLTARTLGLLEWH